MKKKRKKKNAALNSQPSLGSAPDVLTRRNLDAADFAVKLFGEKDLPSQVLIKQFKVEVTKNTIVKWDTVISDHQMFVFVPTMLSSSGSKESFIALLEIAEEEYDCERVVCCLEDPGKDRSSVLRAFMFMGFQVVPPNSPLLPPGSAGRFIFLGCEL